MIACMVQFQPSEVICMRLQRRWLWAGGLVLGGFQPPGAPTLRLGATFGIDRLPLACCWAAAYAAGAAGLMLMLMQGPSTEQVRCPHGRSCGSFEVVQKACPALLASGWHFQLCIIRQDTIYKGVAPLSKSGELSAR